MAADKIEAVKRVSETLNKQSTNPQQEMEQAAPEKGKFQSMIDSNQPLKTGSIERIDSKAYAAEDLQSVETNPTYAEENVSAQKSGTATDQEGKRQRQQQDEEVEGVTATGSKKSSAVSKSLMDEMGNIHSNVSQMSKLDPQGIKTQAKDLISQIDQVKTKLAGSNGQIKPAYQTLLRNRLTHIDDNLKIALSKAGVEYTPPAKTAGPQDTAKNPAQRFIEFLTNSQHQIENLDSTVGALTQSGQSISPANMLAIQLKMNYVQQQMELFTSLLNKALESTKTIMNVQV